jgi:hypothetical protein
LSPRVCFFNSEALRQRLPKEKLQSMHGLQRISPGVFIPREALACDHA